MAQAWARLRRPVKLPQPVPPSPRALSATLRSPRHPAAICLPAIRPSRPRRKSDRIKSSIRMKRVAVLGGGPAGAFAAARLASAGVSTVLLDEKLAWEKPCGGGLTWKAYSQYPFLADNDTPRK